MRRRTSRSAPGTQTRPTRAGRVWAAIAPALVFLIVLIVFIAENGQHVEVSFFGATAHPPLALALLGAAVAGALVVLLAGSVRMLQLRRASRRPGVGPGRSASTPAGDHPQAVDPQQHPHSTRP